MPIAELKHLTVEWGAGEEATLVIRGEVRTQLQRNIVQRCVEEAVDGVGLVTQNLVEVLGRGTQPMSFADVDGTDVRMC